MKKTITGIISAATASAFLQGIITFNIGAAIIAFIYSSVFIITLGIPSYILFKKLNWVTAWQVITIGLILGIMSGFIISSVIGFGSDIKGYALFGSHGAVASFTFWFVAIKEKSSNKAFKPTPKSGAV